MKIDLEPRVASKNYHSYDLIVGGYSAGKVAHDSISLTCYIEFLHKEQTFEGEDSLDNAILWVEGQVS